jgi:hypothetical protein
MRRTWAAALLCLAILATAGPAYGARGLVTGFDDGPYTYAATQSERGVWFDRAISAGAGMVRITVPWAAVAASRPGNPSNPADPAYNFTGVDQAVRETRARGLEVLLMPVGAPAWAEGGGRPQSAPPGTWRPDAGAFGAFGHALAARYGGSYPAPGGGTLPAVSYYQAWNEPNLSEYLNPQWEGRRPASPSIYRALLNAFYDGVKSARPADIVVTGGTSPYGDAPGGARMRPLAFERTLLCVKNRRKLRAAKCPVKPRFDVLAHHPINTSGGPRRSAINPDDASTPDLPQVLRVLRAGERRHKLTPRRHQLWVTEFWWNTNPPNTVRGVSPIVQARWIEDALYQFWKAKVKVALNLQLRDGPFDAASPLSGAQAGLFSLNGAPKPSYTAFRFPFVTERRSPRAVRAWGRAPVSGTLQIQSFRRGAWRTIASVNAGAGRVFLRNLRIRGRAVLRAVVGGDVSLSRKQG